MRGEYIFFAVLLVLSVNLVIVSGLYVEDDDFFGAGHAIKIKNVSVEPDNLVPGKEGVLTFVIENGAKIAVEDLRIQLDLPSEINFFGDVSRVKLSKLESKESKEIQFRVITSPDAKEGIYEGSLVIDYVNYFSANFANVGEDRQDNYTLGIIIKSEPDIFVEIDESNIYKKSFNRIIDVGDVSIKFINNGIADLKFLTVRLEETSDYEIISSNRQYVGDLDSDDFDLLDFKLKIKNVKDEYTLPVVVEYKDSLNNDYEEAFNLNLKVRSARELGVDANGTFYYVLVFVIVFGIGYYIYISWVNKKRKKAHHHRMNK